MSSVEQLLRERILRLPHVSCVRLADKEGVVLVTVIDEEAKEDKNKAKTFASDDMDSLSAVFAQAAEQASKLDIGDTRQIVSMFENTIIVHYHMGPMVLTIVCSPDVNLGLLSHSFENIKETLDPIRNIVAEEVSNDADEFN